VEDSSAPAPGSPAGQPQEAVTPGSRDSATGVSQVEFAACYAAEMPVLVRFLMKCGASEQDAMDAAHNAFVQLYQQWATVRRPKPWLRTVAFRIFLKMPITGEHPLSAEHDQPSVAPASACLELYEEERAVLAAFRQLPMTQRAVFALYFDKFPIREIAEILQMKEDAVRQNIVRARATLKGLLGRA
jgi:RNA polymerase sigma factor (sigma-70 family)